MEKSYAPIQAFLQAASGAPGPEAGELDCIADLVPTRVFYGHNSLSVLPRLLAGYGIPAGAPVLIVTGRGSVRKNGYYGEVVRHIGGRPVIDVEGVTPDAKAGKVDQIRQVIRECRPGLILSVGGGSVMDAAATAAALAAAESGLRDTAAILADEGGGIPRRTMRLVAIPTTAGTGSEVTRYSVITGGENRKIFSISKHFYPDAAILVPSFLATVPRDVIGPVAVDAVAHAVEAVISGRATPESDRSALASLFLYDRYLERYYEKPADCEAAAALSVAACFAGAAFDKAFTAACHGLSFPIATATGISHGEACAMTLVTDVACNCAGRPERMRLVSDVMGLPDETALPGRLRALLAHVGLEKAAHARFRALDDGALSDILAGLPPYRRMYDNDPSVPEDPAEFLMRARRDCLALTPCP